MNRYRLRIPGPTGQLELAALDPVERRAGISLIAHPHPLYGGSMDNKVVDTVARQLADMHQVAVRFNFRGVGESAGQYDDGEGEVDDALAVAAFVQDKYPGLPVSLIGFSFGAWVQSRAWHRMQADHLVLIAPAVTMFTFGDVPDHTVVIHGAEDHLIPLEESQQWALSQGLRVQVVEGADHYFNHSLGALMLTLIKTCSF